MPRLSRLLPTRGALSLSTAVLCSFLLGASPAQAFLDQFLEDAGNVGDAIGDSVGGMFDSDGYPPDEDDFCYAQQKRLADSGGSFGESMVRDALFAGLAAGAGSMLSGGKADAGSALQASALAAGGYLVLLQESGLSSAEVTRQVRSDVRNENAQIDAVMAAFDAVVACRHQQANVIKQDFRSESIDRQTAERRMANVRNRYQTDLAQAKKIADRIAERTGVYATTYNQIAADNGADQLVVNDYEEGNVTPAAAPSGAAATASAAPSASPQQTLQALKASRVRAGPSTDTAVVGNLSPGDKVIVSGQQADWYSIVWGGGVAYVYASLLGEPGAQPAPVAAPAPQRPSRPGSVQVVSSEERPIEDNRVKPVSLNDGDQAMVGDLQEDCITNVRKRDDYLQKVSDAETSETSVMTLG